MKNSVRVRFAPSPTGQVHIGNIRAAIFNYLFARSEGGKFLLRVEDTDLERSTPEAVEKLMEVMDWLELRPDEEPLYQSTLAEAHLDAAEKLISEVRDERERAYRRGYRTGLMAGFFAANGQLGVSITGRASERELREGRFRAVDGGQLELFS